MLPRDGATGVATRKTKASFWQKDACDEPRRSMEMEGDEEATMNGNEFRFATVRDAVAEDGRDDLTSRLLFDDAVADVVVGREGHE